MGRESELHGPLFPDEEQSTAAWFAGALEVGAIAQIAVAQYTDKRGILRTKTQPSVDIYLRHYPALQKLHGAYGGMLKPRYWAKGGKVAAEVVASTLPFAVARREYALAMQNWLNAEDVEEQIRIARSIQGLEWQKMGQPEKYAQLVENPAFIAGILDKRGSLYMTPARNYQTLDIYVGTKNLAILQALQAKYGGAEPRIQDPAGSVSKHLDFETLEDSYGWGITGIAAINLVRFSQPYLLVPPPEKWEYQRGVEKAAEELQLAQRVVEFARDEMKQYQNGDIPKVSNNTMIAARFGIGSQRVSEFLDGLLTPEESLARVDTVRKQAKRGVDRIRLKEVIDFITAEVEAALEGRSDRVSYREELAERFGISIKTIKRDIVPGLDPSIQAARNTFLRSQIAQANNRIRWSKDH